MKVDIHRVVMLLVVVALGCSSAPVRPVSKGTSLLVTKAYLVNSRSEDEGYGAYSYVLLPGPPSADDRYIALLKAYLELPSDQKPDPAGQSTPLRQRNITYAPVVEEPSAKSNQLEWLIDNYDVDRAVAIVQDQQLKGHGPFIVTFTAPLTPLRERVELAVLDLSFVPKESMKHWMFYFTEVSKRPEDWTRLTASYMLLKLHDYLVNLCGFTDLTIQAMVPAGKIAKAFGFLSEEKPACHADKH